MLLVLADRAARWSRLAAEFAISRGLAQAVGMISGLIYVRVMPVDQYALYAMGLTSLSFISVGSDLGLNGSLAYFWRQCAKSGKTIEPNIAAVRRLKSVFLILATVICGVLLLQTARKQDLSMTILFGCFGLVVATAWSQTRTSVDLLLMRLEGRQRHSYYCEAAGSLMRLLLAGAMVATGIRTAQFGLVGGLLGSLSVLVALQGFAGVPTIRPEPIGRQTWREVMKYITTIFPSTMVYVAQGPLILWLALTFGGETPLSETFAVGRIAAIYGLLGSFIITVVEPRLLRIRDDTHFARMTGLFLAVLFLFCAAATIITYLVPSTLLLLIGSKYAHLHKELVLSVAASSLSVITTFLAITNRGRGWVRGEPIVAVCQLIVIFALATHWSYHDSASVLELTVALACFELLWAVATSVIGLLVPVLVRIR